MERKRDASIGKKKMIRQALPGDAVQITLVQTSSWQDAYQGIMPWEFIANRSFRDRLIRRRQELKNPNIFSLVFEKDGRVEGWASVGASRKEELRNESWGELYAFYLLKSSWFQGHGKALFQAVEDVLRKKGFKHLEVWVLTDNHQGRRFYERQEMILDPKALELYKGVGFTVEESRYIKPL